MPVEVRPYEVSVRTTRRKIGGVCTLNKRRIESVDHILTRLAGKSELTVWKNSGVLLMVALEVTQLAGSSAVAQVDPTLPETQEVDMHPLIWSSPLVIVQCAWTFLVTAGAAWYAHAVGKKMRVLMERSYGA